MVPVGAGRCAEVGHRLMRSHARDPNERYRRLSIDRIVWDGDVPRILGPTLAPQPLPVPAS